MRMRYLAIVFAAAFLAAGIQTEAKAAPQAQKYAYVDLGKLFDEYGKTKDSDAVLEKKGTDKQTERDKKIENIKKLRGELELMSEKGKEEKQGQIDEAVKSLQEFDRATRDDLKRERDNMVRDILKEIDTVVQSYGQKEGYAIIFNDRGLLYADKSMDITDAILKILNDQYNQSKKKK